MSAILFQTTTLGVGFKTRGTFEKQWKIVSEEMWKVGDTVKEICMDPSRGIQDVMFPDEKQAAFRCINTRKGLKYQQHGEEEREEGPG